MTDGWTRQMVVRQNAMLPHGRGHLWRCPICLKNRCDERALCRVEFEKWTGQIWDIELRQQEFEIQRRARMRVALRVSRIYPH